jgi:lysyl-tRNA synthetase class 2
MDRVWRTLGFVAVAFSAVLLSAGAIGLLYLVGPHSVPGPLVSDALPLDELPHLSGVSLITFVAVWTAAGALLGGLTRLACLERVSSGILAAVGVGLIVFSTVAFSIFVVRQIPSGEALHAAAHSPAVYLPATIVGLEVALLAVPRDRPHRRAPLVLAMLVAVSGVLDVVSAITPAIATRLHWIENATPNVVPKLASALVVPTGLALVVLADGLRRRRRGAWRLTLALVIASAVMHILKGLDYEEAIACTLLAVALVAYRGNFAGRADPSRHQRLLLRAVLLVAAIFVYGAVAIWINRLAVDRPYSLGFAVQETGESAIGLHMGGSERIADRFGAWFPLSVFALSVVGVLALLRNWLAPWRYRHGHLAHERERVGQLVSTWGVDTLAPFALRADKSYFFAEGERAFLAYKVVAGIAVVAGDPVGPEDAVPELIRRFLAFAHVRGWRLALLGAGERYLDVYRAAGLNVLYHGDEAVVESATFSLEGRAIRKVRQSVSRLEREGYRVEILPAGAIDEEARAELEHVFDVWRGGEHVKGFTMELDTLFRLEGEDALFVIGYGPTGDPRGFLHFAVSHAGKALSLSSMPRLRDTPNGFNEWLVVSAIEWAREHGFERVSLNFAPFAAVLSPGAHAGLTRLQRLQKRVLIQMKGQFQLDNLLAFNDKFLPRWEHRYVIYEGIADLPRVGVAGLAAEGYLALPGGAR